MRIPVCGFDPSLTHWGIAEGDLDLSTGFLHDPRLTVVEPAKIKTKQVRQNSIDLDVGRQLALAAFPAAKRAKVVFVECPVGSQSARAMASYGICMGILGSMLVHDIQLIEVTATEVKKAFTGNRNATKQQMIDQALEFYPDANFPRQRGRILKSAEHVADALGAIHAGVNTPIFQNLMRLLAA